MIELEHIEEIYEDNKFALHEEVLNEIGSYVFVKNRKGEYLYANQLTLELFKTDLESLKGKTDYDYFQHDLLKDILHTDQSVFETGETVINEEHARAIPDGKLRVYRAIKKPIISSVTNEVIGLIGVSTDITDIVEMREKLAELANTDDLTKLYNRRKLWRQFSEEFAHAQTHDLSLSCIVIDIDHFKHINDTFGHDHGDEVIVQLADIARSHIRSTDSCGRIGGEEFLIVLHQTNAEQALQIAERLRCDFYSFPFFTDNNNFSISCGVTELTEKDKDFFDLYRRADKALYVSKNKGRNRSQKL
ncbi:diguanylate cyclase [Vibrio coralliilyticus]|uniref:diguanylate cyclase n=1 Tax=Vibrio coralliilyticus TaxID=190893 RepID=A0A837GB66_9VIBR|nr:GGDEF domain-containing protein [Vibrio coralliilyticus]ERB64935.1 diguanylate cyclase [Vibrio coralliilyticus OCN008]KJY76715.1 diguanylate cyclase [Vibrio coralliilyticus]QOU32894.1 GGDEF domain-containing protein [Vibrio coralliilyticus]